MFGFSVDLNGYNILRDPSYMTFTLDEARQYYVNNTGSNSSYIREYRPIKVESWKNSFVGYNQTLIRTVGIDKYYCPSDLNFTISASYYAARYDYIQLKIFRCVNSTTSNVIWKSTQEIESAIRASKLEVPVTNSFFDFSNYINKVNNVIAYYIWFKIRWL